MKGFKKRNVQITFPIKPDGNDDFESPVDDVLIADKILAAEQAVINVVKFTAITVTAVAVTLKLADTLSQIAVKKTKSADPE